MRILSEADVLVLSADTPGLSEVVNEYCIDHRMNWLHVCYVNDIAAWGPFVIPGETGCWKCRQLVTRSLTGKDELNALLSSINNRYQAPSHSPTNMLAASFAGLDVLKYLGKFGVPQSLNRRVGVWTDDLHLDQQECYRNPECPACGDGEP